MHTSSSCVALISSNQMHLSSSCIALILSSQAHTSSSCMALILSNQKHTSSSCMALILSNQKHTSSSCMALILSNQKHTSSSCMALILSNQTHRFQSSHRNLLLVTDSAILHHHLSELNYYKELSCIASILSNQMHGFHSSHRPRSTTPASGDIFDVVPPAVFCTQDRDTGSCAQYRGAPGWYGAACDGYSLFADDVVLPVNGTNQTTNQGKFLLGRANPVYVDQ